VNRRDFLEALAAAAAAGLPLASPRALAADGDDFYDLPRQGSVSLLHFTDCHAQLKPVYFREPSVNIGIASQMGYPHHRVGEEFLKAYRDEARLARRLRLHVPRLRAARAHVRKDGRLRAPGDAR
jgi:sulfur-oxidizing protein SoxB